MDNLSLEQILIARVDELSGFPEDSEAAYAAAKVQFYVIHWVKNLRYKLWENYKAVTADIKSIYCSATKDEDLAELKKFAENRDEKYP